MKTRRSVMKSLYALPLVLGLMSESRAGVPQEEALKGDSGIPFSELSGSGSQAPAPVRAESRGPRSRTRLARAHAAAAANATEVPPPAGAENPSRWSSARRRALPVGRKMGAFGAAVGGVFGALAGLILGGNAGAAAGPVGGIVGAGCGAVLGAAAGAVAGAATLGGAAYAVAAVVYAVDPTVKDPAEGAQND